MMFYQCRCQSLLIIIEIINDFSCSRVSGKIKIDKTEAATVGVLQRKVFFKISQDSHKKTPGLESLFIKKETDTGVFL